GAFDLRISSFLRHSSFDIRHSSFLCPPSFSAESMNFFTELREGLGISWGAIRANKLRSVLTTLGIVIGIVTVTLMGTAIEGLNRAFFQSISFMGADVLYVHRFNFFSQSQEAWVKMEKRRPLTLE